MKKTDIMNRDKRQLQVRNKKHVIEVDERYSPQEYEIEYGQRAEKELNLSDYTEILLRRKWVLISAFLICVLTVSIFSLLMDKTYKAEASIEIAIENPNIVEFEDVQEINASESKKYYETQYRLLNSKTLANKVIKKLDLEKYPEFSKVGEEKQSILGNVLNFVRSLPGMLKKDDKSLTDIDSGEENEANVLLSNFRSRIQINPIKDSRIVIISFEAHDSKLAAVAVNTLADTYIEWNINRKLDATKEGREFLNNQHRQAKKTLEDSEKNLRQFLKDNNIVSLDANLNLTFKQLAELNDALSKSETNLIEKKAFYKEVEAGNYEYLPQVINDPSIQKLKGEETKLRAQYENLVAFYDVNYPDVKQLSAQIRRLASDLNASIFSITRGIKRDYEIALTKNKMLLSRTEEQRNKTTELNEKIGEYTVLQREISTNESIFQNLIQRFKETEVTSGITATNIQVIDYANVPFVPNKPNILFNILLAASFGLVIGIFSIIIIEHFDRTIKDEYEIKDTFSAQPFLGVVPLVNRNEQDKLRLSVFSNPNSIISESFRVIKTSILYSKPEFNCKSLLVTSTQPDEGKTTVASNLAISLTQSGKRVLIIDADLRKHNTFQYLLDNGNSNDTKKLYGLSDYLLGKVGYKEIINKTNINGLYLVSSGSRSSSTEILASDNLLELLNKFNEEFDHLIIDSPPIRGFADARLLSMVVDGVLLVTSLGITSQHALRISIEEIIKLNGRIIGIIANRANIKGQKGEFSSYIKYYKNRGLDQG